MSVASSRHAITVLFRLSPGTEDRFLALVNANAEASVRDEPGCLLFDVLVPNGETDGPSVFLYEIYTDRAALAHHVTTRHYRDFDAATRDLVTGKEVREFTLYPHRAVTSA